MSLKKCVFKIARESNKNDDFCEDIIFDAVNNLLIPHDDMLLFIDLSPPAK